MFSSAPVTSIEQMQGYSRSDFDYIEFKNIGTTETLDLTGINISGEVKYTIGSNVLLGPGNFIVIPAKRGSFNFRYPGVVCTSGFSGSLGSNGNLTVTSPTFGVIQNFYYQNWWPEPADYGYPLVIRDPTNTDLNLWNLKSSWFIGVANGTPGADDNVGSGVVAFSSSQVLYSNDFTLTLSLDGARTGVTANIFYTTNVTLPSNFQKYTSTISIASSSKQVRAYAALSTGKNTIISSHTYIKLDTTMNSWQVKNLPVVIVEPFGAAGILSASKPVINCYVVVVVPPAQNVIVSDSDIKWHGMARMNVRGSSSSGFAKKSWAIEFYDGYGNTTDKDVFDMPEESDWVLYAPYEFDRVWVRNPLVYTVWREVFGKWAAHTKYVEVFLNQQVSTLASSDYYGLYVWMEKPKITDGRVDCDKMRTWDNVAPNVTGCWLLKVDRADTLMNGLDVLNTGSQQFIYDSPKPEDVTTAQTNYIKAWWADFNTKLSAAKNELNPAYMDLLDLETTIDYFLISFWTKNIDGLRLSTYLFKERNGPFKWSPPWDYDRTLGCDDDNRCPGSGWSTYMTYYFDESSVQYWGRMWSNPQWQRRVTKRYWELRDTVFNATYVINTAAQLAQEYALVASRNLQVWPDYTPSSDAMQKLIDFINQRFAYMDTLSCYKQTIPCSDTSYCTDEICTMNDLSTSVTRCMSVANECPWPACSSTSSNGGSCDDGNICTVSDKCNKGVCAGSPRDCSDPYDCTDDACNTTTGCTHTPQNSKCADLFPCTDESCSVDSGCVITEFNERCDDLVDCTDNYCDKNSGCVYIPNDSKCNDNIDCTNDYCDAKEGCKFVPDDTRCDDGVACTTDRCDAVLKCVNTPSDMACDDGIECTIDVCSQKDDCSNTVDDSICASPYPCVSGHCDNIVALACVYETDDKSCDDTVLCTDDKCTKDAGCVHSPNDNFCTATAVEKFSGPCYTPSCSSDAGTCLYTPKSGCKPPPAPSPSNSTKPTIIPTLECIETTKSGYLVYLGYSSNYTTDIKVEIEDSKDNYFSPAPGDRGQVVVFSPGDHYSFPFSAFTIKLNDSKPVTWYLQSKSIKIDPTNTKICPTVVQIQLTITTKPSSDGLPEKLVNLQDSISDIVGTNVTVIKVAADSDSEVYLITFSGNNTADQATKYCKAMDSTLKSDIQTITEGIVEDSGCPAASSSSTTEPNQSIAIDDNGFVWWYWVIIGVGGLILVVVLIVVIIACTKKAAEDIV